MKNAYLKFNAFTLAEMLVVLFVIGVISMMTIPTVVKVNKERAISDLLSENYKKIELALVIDKISNFDVTDFGFSALNKPYRADEFTEILRKKMKVLNYCKPSEGSCGFESQTLRGYKLRMMNGSSMLINDDFRGDYDPVDNTNRILGATYIDVDGPNGSNTAGRDQFGFYTTQKGLIPMGGPKDRLVPFSDCISQQGLSFACSAWVLLNENMDYKNCPNVINWGDKTTCN